MKSINSINRSRIIMLARMLSSLAVLLVPLMVVLPVSADWQPEVNLVTAKSLYPEIDALGNYVHVTWTDYRDGVNGQIYYKRSADWGGTWGPDVRLTSGTAFTFAPDIEVSGLTVHVVYTDNRTGGSQIYYKRSGDSGLTWGAEVRLSNVPGEGASPRLKSSGSNVYLVWESQPTPGNPDILFIRSTDDGLTWNTPQQINQVTGKAHSPDIASWGSIVGVVWADDRSAPAQIYYKQSSDYGQTWAATDTALTSGATGYGGNTVAITAGAVNVVFVKSVPGGSQLWARRSADTGLTWDAAVRLDGGAGPASNPTIATLGTMVHVAWLDLRDGGNGQIYYKRSNDSGQTWGGDTKLTTGAVPVTGYPTIANSSNNVYVSWADQRDNPANPHLYFKKFSGSPSTAAVNTTMGAVNFSASDGIISGLTMLPPSILPCSSPGYFFPYGMFSFNIRQLAPGETVQVTLTFPFALPSTAKYFKCQDGMAIDCAAFTTRVNDKTIVLTLTDGGNGDSDRRANGGISDPGGPAFLLNTTVSHQSSVPSAPQAPVSLSNVSVRSASLSATKVAPGTPVTVTASVTNTGTGNGASVVKVYVNGSEETSQGVSVSSGGATQVSYDITRTEPGTYTVYVGGTQAGTFTVEQFTPGIILFISGALVFFAFVLGVVYITGRRQQGY